jgi:AraC family transcriptional regulator of adaptative response/methylated-DNA-[protein]-cysteine methyltransferase
MSTGRTQAAGSPLKFDRNRRMAGPGADGQTDGMTPMTDQHRAVAPDVDAARWAAVLRRDAGADGRFVYAVRSTGIYCRPSCPSRRPRRDRVRFYDTAAAAAGDGFRACRRCRPDHPPADPWTEKIRRACVYLANVDGHLPLATLARRLGGSPYHLQRNFKRIVGVTPREYAEACRLRKVRRRLRAGAPITGAMLDAGYGSSSRFYERAVPKLGMSPSIYRTGAQGIEIRFAIVDSPLGRLLVATTSRGVCAVAMGDSDAALRRALEREYTAARVHADRGALSEWTRQVLAHLRGRRPRLDLPLDIQATAFQWQVWQALAAIPYGETRTYGEIAAAIGRPTAARAVARACASNPVALAIPCHRVVPASGGTGGYRWGRTRKTRLLAREAASSREL